MSDERLALMVRAAKSGATLGEALEALAEVTALRSHLATIEAERDRAVGALGRIGAGKLRRDIPFDGAANTSESLHCPQCGCAVSVCDSWLEKNPCPGAIARRALAHATPGVASHPLQPGTPLHDNVDLVAHITVNVVPNVSLPDVRAVLEAAWPTVADMIRGARALATPPVPEKERP